MRTFSKYIGKFLSPVIIQKLRESEVVVEVPGQHLNGISGQPIIKVLDWSFFTDVFLGYDLGFAESYLRGKWDTADLTALLDCLHKKNLQSPSSKLGNIAPVKLWAKFIQSIRSSNSLYWAPKNIKDHYDFSDDMFSSFLDPSMTYSAGTFLGESDTLFDAQSRKLDTILGRVGLKEKDHILDIGCGWGSLITKASSNFGCTATGITLSNNQYSHCTKLTEDLGLEERVLVNFTDYRNMEGTFDHIFAVEMLEAVGHKGLMEFFYHCDRLLKFGGTIQLQVIVVPHQRYAAYRKSCDFTQKYIFRVGLLPSSRGIEEAAFNYGFRVIETQSIGNHYVKTLQHWSKNFERELNNLREKGFSERHLRRFRYYFSYCEVAFASGHIDDLQISLERLTK